MKKLNHFLLGGTFAAITSFLLLSGIARASFVGGGGGGSVSSSSIATSGGLLSANNLADLTSTSTSLINLGLTNLSAALQLLSLQVSGNVTGTSHTAFSTTTASIFEDFDGILYVPNNYTTSTYGDFGTYVNNWYNQQSSTASSVLIMVPTINISSSSWKTGIIFSNNGERASIQCVTGGGSQLNYGGTGTAINENTGAGTGTGGHTFGSGVSGCTLIGPATVTSIGTTTAIKAGGANGAEGLVVQFNNISYFGTGLETSSNTWQYTAQNNALHLNGTNVVNDAASNSGETMRFLQNDIFDPITSSTVQTCTNIGANQASVFYAFNSFDDCGIQIAPGSLNVALTDNHYENPGNGTYGPYWYILTVTSTFTSMVVNDGTFMNDATSSANSPGSGVAFINCGSFCTVYGATADANGAATTETSFMTNVEAAGSAVETVNNVTNINSTGFTNILNGVNTIANNAGGTIVSALGGWPIGCFVNSANLYICYDGGNPVTSLNSNGYSDFGSSNSATTTVQVSGSFGGTSNISGTSSTLSAASNLFQVFTGAVGSNATLPLISSSQGQEISFKNRGTATLTIIMATSTNFIWQSGANASATTYALVAGSSTAFQNDGTYWDQLWK